jgi:hypothetical protein
VETWIVAAGLNGAPPLRIWLMAMYWAAMTLTTIGYGDIVPVNDAERAFSIVVMFIGIGVFRSCTKLVFTIYDVHRYWSVQVRRGGRGVSVFIGIRVFRCGHSCTILAYCTRTLYSYTALVHYTRTLHSCTLLVHCTHTLCSYTALMHFTRTLHSYTMLVHCTHALYSYTALIHYARTL